MRRYKLQPQHERFLTSEELHRIGQALDAAPAERLASQHGATAIRLLVLTGCRRNEILGLSWEDVDFEASELRLRDTKTGARVVPLTPPAAEVLTVLSRVPGNPWVFPGRKRGTLKKSPNSNPCTSSQRIQLNPGRDMYPRFDDFPEFSIGTLRACVRLCHPLHAPVSPFGRPRRVPPNYSS